MATVPSITVPVVADLLGVSCLKCCPCTDELITACGTYVSQVSAAVTLAPLVQAFNAGGQQIMAPLALPVCFACREKQLGRVSKSGLVTA